MTMTYRWVNVGFLLLILAMAGVYLWLSRDLALNRLRVDLRPIMLPVALGGSVVVLSLVELVRTITSKDDTQFEPFRIEGAWRLVATVLIIAAYYVAWQRLDAFYPATVALILALIVVFRWRPSRRDGLIAATIALGFTLLLYLVFDLAFGINFTH
ncbi:tripartite tricarboxylate transporter TctB family protein [Alterinioella nitratireducens]|uniref:tripartite tricarboxylate transporter TctB family protein n=1 Tax=Alterinioella nitratireducens TaxID=2735915 RepID=UPI004059EA21